MDNSAPLSTQTEKDQKTLERIVECSPAFDKRHSDPSKNYGIGSMTIRFVLKGPEGATQFMIGTDWYLPHVQSELRHKEAFEREVKPMGWDIGYHARTPQYDSQSPMEGPCDYLAGGSCYYDGSGLAAEDFVPCFLEGGSDAVWAMLTERYNDLFHTKYSVEVSHG